MVAEMLKEQEVECVLIVFQCLISISSLFLNSGGTGRGWRGGGTRNDDANGRERCGRGSIHCAAGSTHPFECDVGLSVFH